MPTVEGAGVALEVAVRGHGPPALLVHGIAADAGAHAATIAALEGRLRVLAHERRGYGASGTPEPYTGTTVAEQAEDAAAVLRALAGAPALLVGVGFGALICLDLLVRHRALCAGAVLADPPLYAFVPEATEALAAQRALLEEHLRRGGPPAAVEAWLGGRLAGADLARARAAHRAVFADLAGLATWPWTRRELRALDVPVAVVTGPASAAVDVAAADALAALVPGAARRTDGDVAGAALRLAA